MDITCTINETTGEVLCTLPDNVNITSNYVQTITDGENSYYVDTTISYGNLVISFFLFLIFVLLLLKTIFQLFFARSVRIRKYD